VEPAPDSGRPPLRRRRRGQGGVLLGLCAGIGEHLGIDPLLVRLVMLLAMFVATGGLAVLAIYLLFSLFVPLAD
jgi:phage shock protein PspC (stress-responsive transcriptional regulator)